VGNNEWVRLTPKDKRHFLDAAYKHAPEMRRPHCISSGEDVVLLTTAEALAFARQLPEVRTLLAVAKEVVEHINECNDELTVPYVEMADKLSVAIADVEGER